MQFMNYLLLLQIRFPPNLQGFVSFFDVASGKIEGLEDLVPTLPNFILDPGQLEGDYNLLQEGFIDNGIESPFFLVIYQKTILMGMFMSLFIVPGYLLAKKCCRKYCFILNPFRGNWINNFMA